MKDEMKFAVIGAGRMGEAIISGLLQSGAATKSNLKAAEKNLDRAAEIAERYEISTQTSIAEACIGADVVVLAVKPQDVAESIDELSKSASGAFIISVCAGVCLKSLESGLPKNTPIARVMPNTPALIGEGASVFCTNKQVSPELKGILLKTLSALGTVHEVEKESLMDAVTGLSGSGPAYVFTMLEALADGGVLMGLPRALARDLAVQTVLGAARLTSDSGSHTAELKDAVASPAGTTIAGLRELEARGFRSAVIEAVRAAALRSKELGG